MSAPKLLLLLAMAALGGAGITWIALARDTAAAPVDPAKLGAEQDDGYLDARTKGDAEAPVTVFEVSDFQCPFCRQFWEETLPILEREYIATGKVKFVFINFPIAQLHPNAHAAHEFAMCAAAQDMFWPVHDLLYRYQEQWGKLPDPAAYFHALADSVELSSGDLNDCLNSGKVRDIITAESQSVWRAGINSTPSFMIEGGLLPGAYPIDVWRPILDSLVEAKGGRD